MHLGFLYRVTQYRETQRFLSGLLPGFWAAIPGNSRSFENRILNDETLYKIIVWIVQLLLKDDYIIKCNFYNNIERKSYHIREWSHFISSNRNLWTYFRCPSISHNLFINPISIILWCKERMEWAKPYMKTSFNHFIFTEECWPSHDGTW